jgi:hypothetical protein
MKIEIPITDMEFRELILVLKKYPHGIVKVSEKKAVWICELDLTSTQPPSDISQPNRQPGVTGKNNIFSNMANEITNAFGV